MDREAGYRRTTDKGRHEASGYWQSGTTIVPGTGETMALAASSGKEEDDTRFTTHRLGGALGDGHGHHEHTHAPGASHEEDVKKALGDKRFRSLVKRVSEDVYSNGGIRKVFTRIKERGDAGADPPSLKFALRRLGCEITEEEAAEIVQVFDEDGDKILNMAE